MDVDSQVGNCLGKRHRPVPHFTRHGDVGVGDEIGFRYNGISERGAGGRRTDTRACGQDVWRRPWRYLVIVLLEEPGYEAMPVIQPVIATAYIVTCVRL